MMPGRSVMLPDGTVGVVVHVRKIRSVQCAEIVVGAQRRVEWPVCELRELVHALQIVRVPL